MLACSVVAQTEPEPRKSLYKLRMTWPPFLAKRKLSAIDRHVRALDPRWPVMVVDNDPTIFVNRKFIEVVYLVCLSLCLFVCLGCYCDRGNGVLTFFQSSTDDSKKMVVSETKGKQAIPAVSVTPKEKLGAAHIQVRRKIPLISNLCSHICCSLSLKEEEEATVSSTSSSSSSSRTQTTRCVNPAPLSLVAGIPTNPTPKSSHRGPSQRTTPPPPAKRIKKEIDEEQSEHKYVL